MGRYNKHSDDCIAAFLPFLLNAATDNSCVDGGLIYSLQPLLPAAHWAAGV